jgi:hypothetical protein
MTHDAHRLEGVRFADDAARARAEAAGLHETAFRDAKGSGPGGSFTVQDVDEVIKTWA